MTVVFVTGMSGTGKSTVLAELERRGHRVVDTDRGDWTEAVPDPDRGSDRVWREDRIDALLDGRSAGVLFLSGCVPNQGRFYPRFDAVVLLSAPVDVVLERVASRRTNDYGKTDVERARIVEDLQRSSRFSAPARPSRSTPAGRSGRSRTCLSPSRTPVE